MRFSNRGALTLESALVIPIFVAVLLFIGSCLRACYIQDVVQDALSDSMKSLSEEAYLTCLSGVARYSEPIHPNAQRRIDAVARQLPQLRTLGSIFGGGEGAAGARDEDLESSLRTQLSDLAREAALRQLLLQRLDQRLARDGLDGSARLRALGVAEGLEGFDFNGSRWVEAGNLLDVSVSYRIHRLDPFGVVRNMVFTNHAACRLWMAGVDSEGNPLANLGSDAPEEGERCVRTCYVLRDSMISGCYHLADCPNLREPDDMNRWKPVIPVPVTFVWSGGEWTPEGPVILRNRVYTFCGTCRLGIIRVR